MKKIEIENQTLFEVNLKNKWRDLTLYVNVESLKFYSKYWNDHVITVKKTVDTNFNGIELFSTDFSKRNCYRQETYKLISDKELNDDDFNQLRALDVFMGGQETGKLVSSDKENDKFVYKLRSVCDSSD